MFCNRMKIINQTKNTVLAQDVIIADTLFTRLKGLLGKKELRPGQALILKPCDSIHTFFMQFPIDVLFVDRHNKVIKAISNLKPCRLSGIYLSARFAVELSVGIISSSSTQEGDIIQISH